MNDQIGNVGPDSQASSDGGAAPRAMALAMCKAPAAAALMHRLALLTLLVSLGLAHSDPSAQAPPKLCDCSAFFLTAIGEVTANPSEVIAGSRSIKGSYFGSNKYTDYLRSKLAALPLVPFNTYRITFRYRILVAPDRGFETLFYSPTGGQVGDYLPSTTISGNAGESGTRTLTNTLGKYGDYEVHWNVVGTGAISIDDIELVNVTTGEIVATEDAERVESPIQDPQPASAILPQGTTAFLLSIRSAEPTACGYSVNAAPGPGPIQPFDTGAGTTLHHTQVRDLSADPTVVNDVYVRCDSAPTYSLRLRYRSLPDVNARFPRIANLWGMDNLLLKGVEYAARFSLLSDNLNLSRITLSQIRKLNPRIVIVTTINSIEEWNPVPESYYLRDVNGNRIQDWPGAYLLNLTKPEVAEYKARQAYQQIIDSGMMYDGCFFDSFNPKVSSTVDVYRGPVAIDADGDGKADDPVVLDAAWRTGMFHIVRTWRHLLPGAIAIGHFAESPDAELASLFNGDSLVFQATDVLDGRTTFQTLWQRYNAWWNMRGSPVITTVESSPQNQISYGYGLYGAFRELPKHIPPATLAFARDYFPYMRFGLSLSLMNDGYFLRDLGDIDHGTDWWYDEYGFDLGYPVGPAKQTGTLYRRDFTNGVVLLNSSSRPQNVVLAPGLKRFDGAQAPRNQFIVDDASESFSAQGSWITHSYDSGLWKTAGPFYHAWGGTLHQLDSSSGSAQWTFGIAEDGDYTIQVWLPAAPTSGSWTKNAIYEVVAGGSVLASVTLDQTSAGDGDQWRTIGQLRLTAAGSPVLRVHNGGAGSLVADAVHVYSTARYNDGSPITHVTLNAMDGILLQRTQPPTAGPFNKDLVVDFGAAFGLWRRDGDTGAWTQLHAASAKNIVTGDLDGNVIDEVIIDFGSSFGVWVWTNNSTWYRLHASTANRIVTGDLDGNGKAELLVDFPGFGVWVWSNNTSWLQLHPSSPNNIVTGDLDGNGKKEAIIDFPGFGLWVWQNNTSWVQLHPLNSRLMTVGDLDGDGKADLIIDFAGFGIWSYSNNRTWSQVHPLNASHLAAGDVDGNGQSDLIVDFGNPYGIWMRLNGTTWSQLHTKTSTDIVTGDLDSNGQADIIINFGAAGLWEYANDTIWIQLHSVNPGVIATGHIDPP